jgi:hypothetical protein
MMTRTIKRKWILPSSVALTCAALLTACGGDGSDSPIDDGGANPGLGDHQALLYAYPDDQQTEVSTAAPVVLRFSSAVNLGDAENAITLYEGDADTGTVVGTTPEPISKEPNNVLLQPARNLKPNQTYTVVIDDLRLRKGTAKDQTLTFTTRPLHEGPKTLVVKDDVFEVSRRMPDGSAMEPVMDFSSFRFQFTQPIDRSTAAYGDTVTLTRGGETVAASLLVNGAYMTLDPVNDYLTPGESYTLTLGGGLMSTYGEAFAEQTIEFTPKDSSPRGEPAILVQKLTQGTTSRLTGKPVNEVPVNGVLLGENKNITQASAMAVRAELADVTTYPDVTPIRLPKGTVLNGTAIDPVLIGGEIPAGFGSGDVTMTVLSDASGYLVPNPYAGNNPDALRILHLFMDVAIATSEPRANGAFTQDLLHIELVGLAEVDPQAGVLNLDAMGVVEPNILGQEYGYGMLSFQLQSYKDQTNPPVVPAEPAPLTLLSWSHGNAEQRPSLGQPIVLFFNRPVSDDTLESVILTEITPAATTPVPASVYRDGAALIVRPEQPLRRPHVEDGLLDDVSYELSVGGEINLTETLRFDNFLVGADDWRWAEYSGRDPGAPPTFTQAEAHGTDPSQILIQAPVLLMAYPGYPCAIDVSGRDIGAGIAGRCDGALRGQYTNVMGDRTAPPDDLLPIQTLPANDSIALQVTRDIDAESVVLGQTFLVEELTAQGDYVGDVGGHISVRGARITFTPDAPWTPGTLYRYVVKSNGDDLAAVNETLCDGTQGVCGVEGMPLQTKLYDVTISEAAGDLLVQTPADGQAGGPDLNVLFRGGEATNDVWLPLTAKSKDVNANFFHDRENPLPPLTEEGKTPTSVLVSNYREYSVEEEGVDPTNLVVDPLPQDPGGIKPVPNSAKLLSLTHWVPGSVYPGPIINGLSIGCGYQYSVSDTNLQPRECPENKFTYLHSALAVKVTDEYVDGQGIKVLVWPGQILGSSVSVTTLTLTNLAIEIDAGKQVMRMRYAKDDPQCVDTLVAPCRRSKPIVGYISESPNGPVMNIDVDLYIDAAAMIQGLNALGLGGTLLHNMVSIPGSLTLKGDVTFLDDGRIMVDQISQNRLELDFNIESSSSTFARAGTFELIVPEEGAFLRYVGDLAK